MPDRYEIVSSDEEPTQPRIDDPSEFDAVLDAPKPIVRKVKDYDLKHADRVKNLSIKLLKGGMPYLSTFLTRLGIDKFPDILDVADSRVQANIDMDEQHALISKEIAKYQSGLIKMLAELDLKFGSKVSLDDIERVDMYSDKVKMLKRYGASIVKRIKKLELIKANHVKQAKRKMESPKAPVKKAKLDLAQLQHDSDTMTCPALAAKYGREAVLTHVLGAA